MNRILVSAFTLLLSTSALAATTMSLGFEAPRIQDTQPIPATPQAPPQPVKGVTFKDVKALWDQGVLPSEQDLIGSWNSTGWADVSMSFGNQKNYYDETGIKNSDGSIRQTLFTWEKKALDNSRQFSVQFLHYGAKTSNQGPYQATRDQDGKVVSTARYAYISTGGIAATYFGYDCRLSSTNSDMLLCGVTLHIDPSEKSMVPPAQQAYDNVMGGMEIFARVR